MINMEKKYIEILKSILQKYNYSFFLFGSRITKKIKPFSDIDLFYTEDIPNSIIYQLEEDLEESDLPYRVDLVSYNKCDEDFKKIIGNKYVCIQYSSKIKNNYKNLK